MIFMCLLCVLLHHYSKLLWDDSTNSYEIYQKVLCKHHLYIIYKIQTPLPLTQIISLNNPHSHPQISNSTTHHSPSLSFLSFHILFFSLPLLPTWSQVKLFSTKKCFSVHETPLLIGQKEEKLEKNNFYLTDDFFLFYIHGIEYLLSHSTSAWQTTFTTTYWTMSDYDNRIETKDPELGIPPTSLPEGGETTSTNKYTWSNAYRPKN